MASPSTDPLVYRLRICRPALAADIAAVRTDTDAGAGSSDSATAEAVTTPVARDGNLSMRVGSRWVHSSVAPLREAQRVVTDRTPPDGEPDGTVIVGIGVGHIFEALTAAPPPDAPRPWVAIVHDPAVLEAALAARSVEWWCTYGPDRLVPAWLPGTLAPILRQESIRAFTTLRLQGERRAFAEVAGGIDEALARYRERVTVNRNTLRRFGSLWVRNTVRSLRRWGAVPGIEPLARIADGVPAVVCAAGPTLDAVLPRLAAARDMALVVAVDTAVPALERAGIPVDVAVITDPQYWNTRHLDSVTGGDALLVAEPATHPRTLRLWGGPVRMSASLFPLGAWLDERFARTLKLGAGGSVATSAWDLARVLGAPSIALAGADLGFPEYRTHCVGSFFEQRLTRTGHRLAPAEHGLWNYLHGAHATLVPSAGGGTIPSDARMHVYRSWFGEQNRAYRGVSTVLLSPDSSAIPGIPAVDLDTWLQQWGRTDGVRRARRALATFLAAPVSPPVDPESVLTELRGSLIRIRDIASEGVDECRGILARIDGLHPSELGPLLQRLDRIDAKIAAVAERDIAGFLAGPVLDDIGAATPTTARAAVETAWALYDGLYGAAEYHLDLLRRTDPAQVTRRGADIQGNSENQK